MHPILSRHISSPLEQAGRVVREHRPVFIDCQRSILYQDATHPAMTALQEGLDIKLLVGLLKMNAAHPAMTALQEGLDIKVLVGLLEMNV
jgi:hypothetical protein